MSKIGQYVIELEEAEGATCAPQSTTGGGPCEHNEQQVAVIESTILYNVPTIEIGKQ